MCLTLWQAHRLEVKPLALTLKLSLDTSQVFPQLENSSTFVASVQNISIGLVLNFDPKRQGVVVVYAAETPAPYTKKWVKK